MHKILTGMAILALGASVAACNKAEPEANVGATADTNAEMPMDNMAMDANVAVDANAVDANAANGEEATNNVTEQGSTDH